jgi:hypothetical protein
VHYLFTILAAQLDGTDAIANALKFSSKAFSFNGAGIGNLRVFADAIARDAAIIAPLDGDKCMLLTPVAEQFYSAGLAAWQTNGTVAVVNDATELIKGIVQGATVAEQGTATDIGTTAAHLFPMNKNLVKTSSGAGDENKIALLNASGKFADGFQNMTAANNTTLTTGIDASSLHNHGLPPTSQSGTGSISQTGTGAGNLDIDITPFILTDTLQLSLNIFLYAHNDDTSDQTRTAFYSMTGILGDELGGWYCTDTTAVPFSAAPSGTSGTGAVSVVAASGTGNSQLVLFAPIVTGNNLRIAYTYAKTGGGGAGTSGVSASVGISVTKLK